MHLRLKDAALRSHEDRILYGYRRDERYVLDCEAFEFLRCCTGRNSFSEIVSNTGCSAKAGHELIRFLTAENLIEDKEAEDAPEKHEVKESPNPSLRYLQLHVTEKCNLDCRHCYLGKKGTTSLSLRLAKKAVEEFSEVGLKLLITGGEPILYPHIWELLEYAREFPVRVELLSNGTLISEDVAQRLSEHADCVQVSLDGLQDGHELIRGKGSFDRAVEGIKNASKHLEVSVATMIHSGNTHEFQALEELVKNLGVNEWSLDIPSEKGNMIRNKELAVDYAAAAEIFEKHGYGSGTHEGDGSYSCGSHICSINVHGGVSKCGFFTESVGSLANEDLLELWRRITKNYIPKVRELECRGCAALEECRGGCRYRAKMAEGFLGRDPFMCQLYQRG